MPIISRKGKKMKKIKYTLIFITFALTLTACGKEEKNTQKKPTTVSSEEQEQSSKPTTDAIGTENVNPSEETTTNTVGDTPTIDINIEHNESTNITNASSNNQKTKCSI